MRPEQKPTKAVQAERTAFLAQIDHISPSRIKVVDKSRVVVGLRLGYKYSPQVQPAQGARLPLPRYSPDLSPVESAWAKIKHTVKRLRPQGAVGLGADVTAGVESVCAGDAAGWFAHCGYPHQSE